MTKAKDKNVGARGIGLATEHRLPSAFKARTDDAAGTVEIRKQTGRPLDVAINSFASVANVIAVFSPDGEPTFKPEHTIRLIDDFTGKEVTITANTFVDVAAAFQVFIVEKGKYLPSSPAPSADEPAAEAAPAPAPSPAAADVKSKPVAADESEKPKAGKAKASPSPKAAPAKAGKTVGKAAAAKKDAPAATVAREAEAKPSAAKPGAEKKAGKPAAEAQVVKPKWGRDLPMEHVDDSGLFRLEARMLALTKEKAKTVSGIADGSSEFTAFGYEVLQGDKAGGQHAGWVIVEDPKSWIVTGFGDVSPSKHANLNAAAIRIRITNLPRLTQG